jgi:hypothetical protein
MNGVRVCEGVCLSVCALCAREKESKRERERDSVWMYVSVSWQLVIMEVSINIGIVSPAYMMQ